MRGSVGTVLANDLLPEDLRDNDRVLDAGGLKKLLQSVAENHPEKYRAISKGLADLGRQAAQETGGFSFGMGHLRKSLAARTIQNGIRAKVQALVDDDRIDDRTREARIIKAVGAQLQPQQDAVYDEALKANNPLALQVLSGARGKKVNLSSLLAGDLLYTDHRDQMVPVPVLRSYSEGLQPWEYWAGTYGARKGVVYFKQKTAEAGYFGKLLNQSTHRLVVDGLDGPDDAAGMRGLPVDTTDSDSEGSLLARDTGPYRRNTVLSPRALNHLKQLGHDRILVRSPMVGGPASGGVYARDVGVREHGTLPGRGHFPGMAAAQSLAEPITQSSISSKHTGGVAGEGKAISGFRRIESLVQIPKTLAGGAAHSDEDGIVSKVVDAPAGGSYVHVNGHEHYVAAGLDLKVKPGDRVEAGDVLSDGLPNPSKVVQHKGVGEGRRYFVHAFKDAMDAAGIRAHRRNVELLGRGLIDHVKLTGEVGDYVPDDVVPYHQIEAAYAPRKDATESSPSSALGKYLEKPVLHYTTGTLVRPSVRKDLDEFGVKSVTVHNDPPPFEPVMLRGSDLLQSDSDWMVRQYGSGLKGGFLKAVHRGSTSDETGTSFVPSLARGVDFGRTPGGKVTKPQPGWKPEPPNAIKAAEGIPGDGHGVPGAPGEAGKPPTAPGSLPKPPAPVALPTLPSAPPAPVPAPPPAAPPHPLWYDNYHPSSGSSPMGSALMAAAPALGPLGPLAMMVGLPGGWDAVGALTRGGGRPKYEPDRPPAAPSVFPTSPMPAAKPVSHLTGWFDGRPTPPAPADAGPWNQPRDPSVPPSWFTRGMHPSWVDERGFRGRDDADPFHLDPTAVATHTDIPSGTRPPTTPTSAPPPGVQPQDAPDASAAARPGGPEARVEEEIGRLPGGRAMNITKGLVDPVQFRQFVGHWPESVTGTNVPEDASTLGKAWQYARAPFRGAPATPSTLKPMTTFVPPASSGADASRFVQASPEAARAVRGVLPQGWQSEGEAMAAGEVSPVTRAALATGGRAMPGAAGRAVTGAVPEAVGAAEALPTLSGLSRMGMAIPRFGWGMAKNMVRSAPSTARMMGPLAMGANMAEYASREGGGGFGAMTDTMSDFDPGRKSNYLLTPAKNLLNPVGKAMQYAEGAGMLEMLNRHADPHTTMGRFAANAQQAAGTDPNAQVEGRRLIATLGTGDYAADQRRIAGIREQDPTQAAGQQEARGYVAARDPARVTAVESRLQQQRQADPGSNWQVDWSQVGQDGNYGVMYPASERAGPPANDVPWLPSGAARQRYEAAMNPTAPAAAQGNPADNWLQPKDVSWTP